MKRIGNIFDQITSLENIRMADAIARIGKKDQYGIVCHDRNRDANIMALQEALVNKTFTTSAYKTSVIKDPKERIVSKLPYRDRIVHHALMIPIERMFINCFTSDSYASIKGRGVHAASDALMLQLRDQPGTKYCLKLDVKKFYPNVDHDVLKTLIRRKIKDPDALWLIDDIIDSAPGLPIGNYTSAFFANLYLNGLDHTVKEVMGVKNYIRYMDDIIITAPTKEYLHQILFLIRTYLAEKLKLSLKENYRIFPSALGIDAFGYVHYYGYKRLRKRVKQRFARAVASGKPWSSIASYLGWASHANCNHLLKKLLNGTNQFQIIKYPNQNKIFRRTKYRGRRHHGSGDHNTGLQDRTVQVPGEIREMPHSPDQVPRQTAGGILRFEKPD